MNGPVDNQFWPNANSDPLQGEQWWGFVPNCFPRRIKPLLLR